MLSAAQSLLLRPRLKDEDESGVVNRVTASEAGWQLLNIEVRRLKQGETWSQETGGCETALVVLGGRCSVISNRGEWPSVGRRVHAFDGMPYALYLPRKTSFELTAQTDRLEFAYCWAPAEEDHPPCLITPSDCEMEIRGGYNATRQINHIIPPGFDCQRIVCVEVYTPSGNWSSYPPHKHDDHREDEAGNLLEVDLEEVYFYKVDKPQGYAIQRVYTADRSIDAVLTCQENDIVLVPEGYHPVVAAYGYNCYYLNFMAGSAQSLASSDEPAHAWTRETWTEPDPRLPLVHLGMEAP